MTGRPERSGFARNETDHEARIPGILDSSDCQSVVRQAVGMVSVQWGCGIKDAADLLTARAFADGRRLGDVAPDIVRGAACLQ